MSDAERWAPGAAPGDRTELRAGDADREAVAERLRVAAGEGRLNLAELEARLEHAYGARTYGELEALVADLPREQSSTGRPETGTGPETLVLKATKTSIKQSGPWSVPRRIVAECTNPWITIDFTEAHCAHREITVEAVCGAGWIRLIVPQGWAVRVDPLSTNTAHIKNRAANAAAPMAPTVLLIGHPRSGYIRIKQRGGGR